MPLPAWINDNRRPPITVLCGSTRFKNEFNVENARLTLCGHIVISVGVFGRVDMPEANLGETNGSLTKIMLDKLHKRKIDLADLIYVINPGGYIGESTRSEIEYAKLLGLPIDYYTEFHGS